MKTIISKILNFNPSKAELNLKILFLNEEILGELLEESGKNSVLKVQIKKSRYSETTKDSSRRRWFQIISTILKQKDIPLTKENVAAFHETMKESFFDVEKFVVDGKEIIVVPSINVIEDKKVKEACENIIDRYSKIGVDFSDIL